MCLNDLSANLRWQLLLGLLVVSGSPTWAACPPEPQLPGQGTWIANLYFENDLFAESDQNYTNGVRFSALSPDLDSFTDDPALAGWIQDLNRAMGFLLPGESNVCLQSRRLVLTLGQSIYTPQDIAATEVLQNQRPYAGWLYIGVAYNIRRDARLDTVGLYLGIVGPAAMGQETQDLVHELRGFDKFQGWDNQLANEPGFQLGWEQKRKWGDTRAWHGWGSDVIGHAGWSFGNVATYLNLGAEVRWGWHIPDDFGTSALRPGADNSAPGRNLHASDGKRLRRGAHLFASVDGRWVMQDIFLDGNTFADSHRVDKERLVADTALGVSVLFGDLEIAYAQILRTREFKQQPHTHSYGSLSLSWTHHF